MAYAMISFWETTDWTDEMEALARDKFVPMIMSVGAERVSMVRTGENSFFVMTVFADQATGEAAQVRIADIRAKAAEELPMSMTSSEAGPIFAGS